MKVYDHIGGSWVVVELNANNYIDARKDVRTPEFSHVEMVYAGQVITRRLIENALAPTYIIGLMKAYLKSSQRNNG